MLNDPLFYVVAAACLVVLVILGIGIASFGKGGENNSKFSNKMMRYRIYAQFVAIVLILAFVALRRMGG